MGSNTRMRQKWLGGAFAGTAVVALLVAGCGANTAADGTGPVQQAAGAQRADGYGSTSTSDGYGGSGSGQDAAAPAQTRPAGQLALHQDRKLGSVVTNSQGFTLYRFDEDSAKPPTSNCAGECAKKWPPVPAGDVTASSGLDPDLLSEVMRADGTRQLTLAGWPMYYFAKDSAPGQTNGHGVDGTWHAVAPDGSRASRTAAGRAPLSVSSDAELGQILVDGKGRTLYRFTKDTAWPKMKSNCEGACAQFFKPAKPVDAAQVQGIDPKLITKPLQRPDGTRQLAIDCWPVYWFTGDTKPGDTNGQGLNKAWFALGKDGKKVTTPLPGR